MNALIKTGDAEADALAFELAERWIKTNFVAFYQAIPHAMFEKVWIVNFVTTNIQHYTITY